MKSPFRPPPFAKLFPFLPLGARSEGGAMIGPEMEAEAGGLGPKKKKYAKEAWPGKKPALPSLLV